MSVINITNKETLLEECSHLEDKVNTLSSYVEEIKTELNRVGNVDDINLAGKAGMLRVNLDNALKDVQTVTENMTSYATQINTFDRDDFVVASGFDPLSLDSMTPISSIAIPDGLGKVHTYMGWQIVKKEGTPQYRLRDAAGMNFDSEGFGIIDGRYVVSVTSTIGKIGDYIDVVQEDGSIIHCIIGYNKNQKDDDCNEWGHLNGQCVVEFVVDKDMWYGNAEHAFHTNPGTGSCHPEWRQNITRIDNLGNYFDLHGDVLTSEEVKETPSGLEVSIKEPVEKEVSTPIIETPVVSNDVAVGPIPEAIPVVDVVPPVLEAPLMPSEIVASPLPEVGLVESGVPPVVEPSLAEPLITPTIETPTETPVVQDNLVANEEMIPPVNDLSLGNVPLPETNLTTAETGWWDAFSPAFFPELASAVPGLDLSSYHNRLEKGFVVTVGNPTYEVSQSDFQLLCAIVTAESDHSADDALAVASALLNRCDTKTYNITNPIEHATKPEQFVVYQTGKYLEYMDNPPEAVVKAVSDALMGVRNHTYLSFRWNGGSYSDNLITPDGNRYGNSYVK